MNKIHQKEEFIAGVSGRDALFVSFEYSWVKLEIGFIHEKSSWTHWDKRWHAKSRKGFVVERNL
jgi:hypothetical protein